MNDEFEVVVKMNEFLIVPKLSKNLLQVLELGSQPNTATG